LRLQHLERIIGHPFDLHPAQLMVVGQQPLGLDRELAAVVADIFADCALWRPSTSTG